MDCDEEYSFTIVSFLRDIEWIEQEPRGKYVNTDKGISQGWYINKSGQIKEET